MDTLRTLFAIFTMIIFSTFFVFPESARGEGLSIECTQEDFCSPGIPPITSPPSTVHAMVVYAKDANDYYPFPSESLRNSIYSRMTNLYSTMSYGAHTLTFKETTNNGDYFVSDFSAPYYHNNYNAQVHSAPYGMFNEEILNKVKNQKGDSWFGDVDMIIMVGTDGGVGWYMDDFNGTGIAKLGVDFTAGGKTFGACFLEGGVTLEIGSDIGTPDPSDDRLNFDEEIYWIFAHEYGHTLNVHHPFFVNNGIYSLMSKKLHNNSRQPEYGPAPLDAVQLLQLGWINELDSNRVKVVTSSMGSKNVTLNQIRSNTGLVLAKIEIPNSDECFYVVYHRQNANQFDGVYVSEGLITWHSKPLTNPLHEHDIEVGEATGPNGRDHLDDGTDTGGLSIDFFNSTNNFNFTPWTNPSSEKGVTSIDSHSPNGISITDIQESGDQVTFKVSFDYEFSGAITKDTNWHTNVKAIGNVSVESGATLTIEPGTVINFSPSANMFIRADGNIRALGEYGNEIQFTSQDGTFGRKSWGTIFIHSSYNQLEHCNVRFGDWGVKIHGYPTPTSGNMVIDCHFADNDQGLRIENSQVNVVRAFIANNRHAFVILNNSSVTIKESYVLWNDRDGIYSSGAVIDLYDNLFEYNGEGDVSTIHGIRAGYGANISFGSRNYYSDPNAAAGLNTIRNNRGAGIYVAYGAHTFVGDVMELPAFLIYRAGQNSLYQNGTKSGTSYSGKEIYNTSSNWVYAENNYWGGTCPPSSSQTYGPVGVDYCLGSSPTSFLIAGTAHPSPIAAPINFVPDSRERQTSFSSSPQRGNAAGNQSNADDIDTQVKKQLIADYK